MTLPPEGVPERRQDWARRREIDERVKARVRAEDRRQLVKAVAALTLTLLAVLVAMFIARESDQAERDRTTRTGCDSGNVTRAYVLIFADGFDVARGLSSEFAKKVPRIEQARRDNPIIQCEFLPQRRVVAEPAAAAEFVRAVREGNSPLIRDGGVTFKP